MFKSIDIPVHSVVDLITNSSSEIFVMATDKTVTTIRNLVDALLKLAGSTQSADELFTFELMYYDFNDDEYYPESEFDTNEDRKKENHDGISKSIVRVTAKTVEGQNAAAVLSRLHSIFPTQSVYN